MKTIGLIGGMSWESTVPYYRQINEAVRSRLGGLHSAKLVLHSVDFAEIEKLQREGEWDAAGLLLADAARSLESAGADFLVLCTNTMHKVAARIEAAVGIPLLHIADPTGAAIRRAGHSVVGLIGTRFTMEEDFYRDRLAERHGLKVIVPDIEDRETVHRIIYEELCVGTVDPASRDAYRRIMQGLVSRGAQAVVLGCTEVSLLVGPRDAPVPLFDTTALHALAAAEKALARDGRLELRPLCEDDLPLLHAWLNRPHVSEWWGNERPTLDQVRAEYAPDVLAADGVTPYIATLDGVPFAYAQSYVALGSGEGWWEDETDPGVRGIDQSIGEFEMLNRGLGTRLVQALVDRLFADPAVTKVQTDPAPHNARAIRCYEKAGFRRIRTVVTPDGPAVYMLCERPWGQVSNLA